MESMLREWDGEEMIVRFDAQTGAWILIGIHSTRLGPATGGTRMKSYPNFEAALQDVMNLSRGMTYKFAAAGIDRGGGKTVIAVPPDLDPSARPDLLRRFGALMQQLGGLFMTGVDVGTSPEDMDVIAETGAPYVFCRTPANGGAGDASPYTAWGVFSGMQATCEHVFGNADLAGKRVAVQGVGSVGRSLIELLREVKAEVVFTDVNADAIKHHRDELGLHFVAADSIYDVECEIFAPCALGGALNVDTIARLKCRAVAGAANNQLASPEDAARLRDRDILYAPDYVINAGGAIAINGIEALGWSHDEAMQRVAGLRQALSGIYAEAAREGITTDAAAQRIAEKRLKKSSS